MPSRLIRTADDLDLLFTLLGNVKLPLTVDWVQGADRTGQQNRLMWKWAQEASEQRGDVTPDEVQREWKLNHGIPILCEDSEDYRRFCTATLKHLTYQGRVAAMRYVPVTSEMKVKQMVRFMDTVERECVENGIQLTQPDPELANYQDRYRDKPERKAA
jgi:hypothetical protein